MIRSIKTVVRRLRDYPRRRAAWRRQQLKLRSQAEAAQKVARYPSVAARKPHGLDGPLIVSLTSYPPRFPILDRTLKGLLDQTVRADRTILWIDEGTIDQLPAEVLALKADGLEIRETSRIRAYAKLIPTLRENPDAYIVTADDDHYYPPNWLETLVSTFDPAAPAIVFTRAHRAGFGADGRLTPYQAWEKETAVRREAGRSHILFPTGVGGVLYPPGSLGPDVLDQATFTTLSPHADDVWFFWMARRNGFAHLRTDGWFELVPWPEAEDSGLRNYNVDQEGNDVQVRAMEDHFGLLPPTLSRVASGDPAKQTRLS